MSKAIQTVAYDKGFGPKVEALTPSDSGSVQVLERGLLNLVFDGVLIATLHQDKARRLATAILMALDVAASDTARFAHLAPLK